MRRLESRSATVACITGTHSQSPLRGFRMSTGTAIRLGISNSGRSRPSCRRASASVTSAAVFITRRVRSKSFSRASCRPRSANKSPFCSITVSTMSRFQKRRPAAQNAATVSRIASVSSERLLVLIAFDLLVDCFEEGRRLSTVPCKIHVGGVQTPNAGSDFQRGVLAAGYGSRRIRNGHGCVVALHDGPLRLRRGQLVIQVAVQNGHAAFQCLFSGGGWGGKILAAQLADGGLLLALRHLRDFALPL